MYMTIVASREVFEHALSTAGGLGEGKGMPLTGLHAPLDHIRVYLEEAWTAIDEALRQAFLHGKERAGRLFESARSTVQAMIEKAGHAAEDLQTAPPGEATGLRRRAGSRGRSPSCPRSTASETARS